MSIARLLGETWTAKAWEAAIALSAETTQGDSQGSMLLEDIKQITDNDRFKNCGTITSKDLSEQLNSLPERPWGGWRGGRGIEPRDIARILDSFKINPGVIRAGKGNKTARGYRLCDFKDAFERYLNEEAIQLKAINERNNVTEELFPTTDTVTDEDMADVTECNSVTDDFTDATNVTEGYVPDFSDRNTTAREENDDCYTVTDKIEQAGDEIDLLANVPRYFCSLHKRYSREPKCQLCVMSDVD